MSGPQCETCTTTAPDCITGEPIPNMCTLGVHGEAPLFDSDIRDHLVGTTVLGMCCFFSVVFMTIGGILWWTNRFRQRSMDRYVASLKGATEQPGSLSLNQLSYTGSFVGDLKERSIHDGVIGQEYGINGSRRVPPLLSDYSMDRSRRHNSSDDLYGIRPRRVPVGQHGNLEILTREVLGSDSGPDSVPDMSTHGSNISDLAFCVKASDIVLHEVLGEGFYGKVLSARWQGNWVAVKVLKHKKADQLNEVLKEVALLIRLRHPNVIAFYGCTAPPEPYIISELLWGSLFKLLHDNRSPKGKIKDDAIKELEIEHLSDIVAFRIVKDIANGLSYIHDRGIIHRDVSTSNILVTGPRDKLEAQARKNDTNPPPFAKISDFGLSRGVGIGYTSSAVNLLYLSPEGYRGEPISTQSDVFSYAMLIWEVYTCKRPYEDEENDQLAAYKVTCEGLRPPVTPEIPGGVSMLMQNCWKDDPNNRPTMKAVVVALEELESVWQSQKKQIDEYGSDTEIGGDKWDEIAIKPAINTYTAFDAEDDVRRSYMQKKDSNRISFRIGDLDVPDDEASGFEEDSIDKNFTTRDDHDVHENSAHDSQSGTRDDDVESTSSVCSLDRKAEEHSKDIGKRNFLSPSYEKGKGHGAVKDVYHEFLHGSLVVATPIGEDEDDVPGGEKEEHGGEIDSGTESKDDTEQISAA